jgi:predicted nucleotidyltransferase
MGKRSVNRVGELRARVAEEAARVMREQGVRDYLLAKRKAADRLGVIDRHALPANQEVADALAAQQRLFGGAAHRDNLKELREAALRAMALLRDFNPRLVGPVLTGTATPHSDVSLHVFAETPEDVAFLLIERGIRYRSGDRRVRLAHGEHANYPSFEFETGSVTVDAMVFPTTGLRQAPLCPITGGPMRRARREDVEDLLAAPTAPEHRCDSGAGTSQAD